MKVGIMSMQRIINYGSFLQAYSLKKNIEALGGEVQFVDYRPGQVLVIGQQDRKQNRMLQLMSKVLDKVIPPVKLSKEQMKPFWDGYIQVDKDYLTNILPLLGVTEERNYNPELDLLVIGSDEVFNCLQPSPHVGYAKELFGFENHAQKVISYAASFGNTKADGLKKYGIYDEVKSLLNEFDGISARDKNTFEITKEMTGKDIVKNVDPVFLYDYTQETDMEVPIDNYIAVYAYAKRISKKEAGAIKQFAKKYHKKIICLCAPQEYLEGYIPLNPFEILAYIRKADYVVTDTFHGTVFSIKNNRNFATFLRGGYEASYGNNEKLYDLLETFGLTDRSVENLEQLEDILLRTPDYQSVNQKIQEEKNKATEYLSKYVKP